MLRNQTTASLIARLQRFRKHAEGNRNFNGVKRYKGQPYFSVYPPEVQTVCWEFYNSLYLKHGHKLQADPSYVRVLVATATRLALDKLGITQISKSGFHRTRAMNKLRYDLGIRDKREDQVANNKARRVRNAKAAARLQERDLSLIPE